MLRCSLRENAVSGCLIQRRRRRQQVPIRCTKDLRVWIVRLLRVFPLCHHHPHLPTGGRSEISYRSLCFFFSLALSRRLHLHFSLVTERQVHEWASTFGSELSRPYASSPLWFLFPGTRRGHVCTCYFQEAGCERVPRCDCGWFLACAAPSLLLAEARFPRPCVLSTSSCRRGDAKLFCQNALKEGRETRPFATLCWLERILFFVICFYFFTRFLNNSNSNLLLQRRKSQQLTKNDQKITQQFSDFTGQFGGCWKSVKLTLTYINFKTSPRATTASSSRRTAPEFISNHVGGKQMRVSGIFSSPFSSPRVLVKGGVGGERYWVTYKSVSKGGALLLQNVSFKNVIRLESHRKVQTWHW